MHTAYPDVLEYLRLWQLHWYVAGVCFPASVSPMLTACANLGLFAPTRTTHAASRFAVLSASCKNSGFMPLLVDESPVGDRSRAAAGDNGETKL